MKIRVAMVFILACVFRGEVATGQEQLVFTDVAGLEEALTRFVTNHPRLATLKPWKKTANEVAWCAEEQSGLVDHRLTVLNRDKISKRPVRWNLVGRYDIVFLFKTVRACKAYRS